MQQKSIWEVTRRKRFHNRMTNKEADVVIIGGGMAGLTTAYFLKDQKKKVVLLEKGRIASGVTAHSTGKLTFFQGIYTAIEKARGKEAASLYLTSQKEAIQLAESIIFKEQIKCNYHQVPSYLIALQEKEKKQLKKEADLLRSFGIDVLEAAEELPIKGVDAIKVEGTAVFHPVKFLLGLRERMKELIIQERTMVTSIKEEEGYYHIHTKRGTWRAKTVVVATHYPFFWFPGWIPFITHLDRSYIVACACENSQDQSGITIGKNTRSYRYHQAEDAYFLFAGESHRMTNHYNYAARYQALEQELKQLSKDPICYRWMTHDVMSEDSLPIIGELRPNLFLATAFNKWGMTNGLLAGKICSDLITKGTSPYEELVSPKRKMTLPTISSRLLNGLSTGSLYLKTALIKNHSFYQTAYVVTEQGVPYGVYIDEQGISHKVKNKCPHLKCNLIFNRIDKTWDCPCHGSRFSIDGDVVEGPSTSSIRI